MKFALAGISTALIASWASGFTFTEFQTESAPAPAIGSGGHNTGTDLTSDEESRIYGGSNANIGKYPYMVGLHDDGPGSETFCVGTLIAPQYIPTAGHCLESAMHNVYTSIESKYRSGEGSQKAEQIHVVEAFRHPMYRLYVDDFAAVTHDVGLLKLELPSKFQPAPMARTTSPTRWQLPSDEDL